MIFKCLILIQFIFFNENIYATSIKQQRQNYKQIKTAYINHDIDIISSLLPKLKKYPLYPYLQYEFLIKKIKKENNLASIQGLVKKFINKYSDIPIANSMNNYFINLLAQHNNGKTLLNFSPNKPKQTQALCNWYYIKWLFDKKSINIEALKKIWLSRVNILHDCNKLLLISNKHIKIPSNIILELIGFAMKANNDRLITCLTKMLPPNYKNFANLILQIKNNPSSILNLIKKMHYSSFNFNLQVIRYSLLHLSRKNPELAKKTMSIIIKSYHMTPSDIQVLKEIVANNMIQKNISNELNIWRNSVIANSKSTSLIEQHIRKSLMNNNRTELKFWISRLPLKAKEKEEWQYWQADILYLQGKKKQAKSIFYKLIKKRNFYSLVAAQRLGINYFFKNDIAPAPDNTILTLKEMPRIRELMYWKQYNLASNEWNHLISNKTVRQLKMLARYANEQKWWNFSVKTTIQAKIWDNIKERFPLAWNNLYIKYTNNKNISKNYAMAISRQESGWDPDAHSLMNAIGLMQIEPNTAKQVIKIYHIKDDIINKLFDPEINIWIGTNYLEYIFKQLGKNRILTSAAYNAGLSNINIWKHRSAGKINAIAFIEAIPFLETRQYVKNVLLYNAYYNYLTGKPRNILTSVEWNHRY
ncbi:murein transglycosylase [Candidatus Pantoea edessiphila]|nr:murein transglycosylase [Candidatus Pantoea edessiphila]